MDESAEATARSGDGPRRYVDVLSRWFLLDGNRRIVAGILLLGVGVVFGLYIDIFGSVSDSLPAFYALSGLIAGNLALPDRHHDRPARPLAGTGHAGRTPGDDRGRLGVSRPGRGDDGRGRASDHGAEVPRRRPDEHPRGGTPDRRRRGKARRAGSTPPRGVRRRDRQRRRGVESVVESEDARPFEALVRALYVDYGIHL